MMISVRFITMFFLFLALLLGTIHYVQAWTIENGVAVCTTTTSQTGPRSIEDGSGGAIICWREIRSGNYYLCAQRINSYGSTLWNPTEVTLSTSTHRKDYRVIVSDNAGGAIIAWDEIIKGNYDLFAQRIDSNGTILWGSDGLTVSTATLSQYMPSAVPDGEGGVFITWRDSRNYSTSNEDIYAQRINSVGSTLWTENGIPVCTDNNIQITPKMIEDGFGGFIVTWCDATPVGYYKYIYAQRVNGNGTIQWASRGVSICTVSNDQDWQSIVSDESGGAIIIWQDERISPGGSLYAQRINSSGTPLWGLNGLAVCTVNYVYAIDNIKMVPDGLGGAVFVWMDNRLINTYPDLYAQRINSSGNTLWGVDGLAIATSLNNQEYETIISDDMGGAIISWGDARSGVSDIYAQHVDSTGSILWANNGLAICSSAQNQNYPWITRNESGDAIIVWQDSRPVSQTDVYAQRVDGNGNTDFVPVELIEFEAILPE